MRNSLTEEEILALMDEYDKSNMTVKEFCELCVLLIRCLKYPVATIA